MTNATIYYHPEAYSISGQKLMGRNAAGESFLRGYVLHSKADAFWLQVQNPAHAEHFVQSTSAIRPDKPVKVIDSLTLSALSQAGLVYYPGPGIGAHAFSRAAYGHAAWSVCGITHTTSSARAMDAICDLITHPVQPWDALICTSEAVKENVNRILMAQAAYLNDRLGVSKIVLPQLPVIPLGIHTADFDFDDHQKNVARTELGIDSDTLVVLYMGRLSFHAKAHPLSMYLALEQAAKETGRRIVLIECGWHANEFIQNAYIEATQSACPSIKTINLDGRNAEARRQAWASADIFCSFSDNIQETFGLVPIEAMAAGIPVVVSDWDGYKESVRDGIDGFRIPTLMPASGFGVDLAIRHALEVDTYDMYCGHTSSLVAVDIQAATVAFVQLINSAELRARMGEAGRIRAKQIYDWSVIIPKYENLWTELAVMRSAQATVVTKLSHPWPARLDPFYAFAGYPTNLLHKDQLLRLADNSFDTALLRYKKHRNFKMVGFAQAVLPVESEVETVLHALAAGALSAEFLVKDVPDKRRAFVFRSLVWMIKIGVLEIAS